MTDYLWCYMGNWNQTHLKIFTSASYGAGCHQTCCLQHFGQNPGSTEVPEFYIDSGTAKISVSEDNLYASVN